MTEPRPYNQEAYNPNKSKFDSFRYAFNGIKNLLSDEFNFKIHAITSCLVIILGFLTQVSNIEWIILIICISMVLVAEGINTSIERLCDVVCQSRDERIKYIKDVAAGAVLICALGASIVGSIIFLPKILSYL